MLLDPSSFIKGQTYAVLVTFALGLKKYSLTVAFFDIGKSLLKRTMREWFNLIINICLYYSQCLLLGRFDKL